MTEEIRRVAVWSGWLRFVHWALAAATLILIATGWLVANSPALAEAAADIHFIAASVLIAALALRLSLGIAGKGSDRFGYMLPQPSDFAGMRASLLFFLSLGKAPLPSWYAHNPLWKPIYLMLFVLLALSAVTGWIMPEIQLIGRFYLPKVHSWLSNAIILVTAAHVFSVTLQDVKGKTADISAMFNGYRYFSIERDRSAQPGAKPVSVKLDDFGKL